MSNRLIVVCLLAVLATSCGPQIKVGQSTLSPDNKWFIHLETQSLGPTNGCARIDIYDTAIYPSLKTQPLEVNRASGPPTASFTVPIFINARSAELKWNTASTVLRIEQRAVNANPAIYYAVDVTNFSFSKVDK